MTAKSEVGQRGGQVDEKRLCRGSGGPHSHEVRLCFLTLPARGEQPNLLERRFGSATAQSPSGRQPVKVKRERGANPWICSSDVALRGSVLGLLQRVGLPRHD
jgi:hypothetical protein